MHDGRAGPRDQGNQVRGKQRTPGGHVKAASGGGFELDMASATLLHRRHNKPTPLREVTVPGGERQTSPPLDPGSPMHGVEVT
jgi:hypothetical protein